MKKIIFCLTVFFAFIAMGTNLSVAQTPIITSITPSSGVVGSSVTLTGANFDPVPSNNTVFFGGVRASVTAASTTSLTVTVPLGAAYSTISVTKSGLTATSAGYFTVTFPGGVGSTMSPPINDSVGNNPLGVAVGDFNGDGKLDMAVANSGSNSVSILLGTGAGTFGAATNYGVGSSPYGITVGDFNGDGNLDVAVADYSGNAVSVLLGTGTGTFGVATNYPVGFLPFGIAVGDFNGDGKLDLAVTNLDSDSLSILIGTGTGTFGTATNYAVGHQPGGIVVGDFNGDGKLDVAVANQQGGVGNNGSVSILLGNGDGTFGTTTNYNAGSAPNSITAGDFNGDGILDLAVTSSTGNNNFVSVILGSGTGTFGAATQYPGGNTPLFITTGDFNGDGKLDVALANQNGNSVSILLGTGTGAFDSASNYPVGVVPYGITVGDFNGDGRADLAVANYLSSNVSVLLNVPPGSYTILSGVTGGNGTITPLGATAVNQGNTQVYTLTPNTGYHIDSVFVDGSYVGNTSPDTISNVTANHTISVKFAVNTYTITSSITGGNGTITPLGTTNVNYGSNQIYTITPNAGYYIDSIFVDGNYAGNSSPDTIKNVNANHSIIVKFRINTYTISSSVTGGNGMIAPSGPTIVNYGSNPVYTMTPNAGYHVDSVFIDGSYFGNTSPDTINNVTANHSVTVKFAVNTYTFSSSVPGENGTVTLGLLTVNYGGTEVYSITPNSGYHIDSIFVDGNYAGNTSPDTVKNVTANHSITVKFAINTYTITSNVIGGNGSIAPSGITTVNYGANQIFTTTPNTGYHVDTIFVDGNYAGNTSPDTIKNVSANHTIAVKFAINTYTLVSGVTGGNGTIAPPGTTIVNYGGNNIYILTPNTGYHIDSVFVDGGYIGNISPDTMKNVTANHTVTVKFAINTYTITVLAGSNGIVFPSGPVVVPYGGSQAFTITANPGNHIDSVFADGISQGAIAAYSFSNVTSNHSLRATFAMGVFLSSPDTLNKGWNIVSVPVTVSDYHKTILFPTAISEAFAYQGSYEIKSILTNDVGYWLKTAAGQTVTISGFSRVSDTIGVTSGWNLIGSLSNPLDVATIVSIPSGIILSNFFGFQTGYKVVSVIDPGKGYWIKVNQNGSLILNESKEVPKSASQENPLEQLNKLEVTDALGNTQTLYFGPAESRQSVKLEKYELPPVPPSGIFDIRFASSNIVTLTDSMLQKTVLLQISGAEYPLKINWEIIAHNSSSNFMTIGTRTVAMQGSGTVDVISDEDQISLTLKPQAQNEVPLEYALQQNYPNPFNPTATIRFDLPAASHVSLKIFNTLGQIVATLTDGVEGPGYKSVQWSAGGFASGVYMYRISATSVSDPNKNFTQVRKMVLVK